MVKENIEERSGLIILFTGEELMPLTQERSCYNTGEKSSSGVLFWFIIIIYVISSSIGVVQKIIKTYHLLLINY